MPGRVPPMPNSFPEDAELVLVASPNLTVAEAYWIAACQALGVSIPTHPTHIRIVRTVGGRRVEWREDGKRRRRSFNDPSEAESWAKYLHHLSREPRQLV